MQDINLFGELQEYYDPEIERVNLLKEKIKKLIIENDDYEMFVSLYDGQDEKPPSFDEFWKEQADHLAKFHDKCKDWDEFICRYSFCIGSK